jgi:chromate transporter
VKSLLAYFLKIGSSGFGGPIALIGMMEDHFVRNQKTVPAEDFRRYVAAAKLFPGPTSTLIAIRIGQSFQGWRGGLIAWLALISPAFVMVIGLSTLYSQTRSLPSGWWNDLTIGLNLGGLALSVLASIRFAKPLLESDTWFYFVASGTLTFFYPQQEIFFLLGCGILAILHQRFKHLLLEASATFLVIPLFLESFKASIFTFGSGIAIVPVLKATYLDQHQWISHETFLTGLSVGQMTPGPLVIMNSFLGHQAGGLSGAIAATFGTFLPTLIFGIVLMPAFERKLLNAPLLKSFFRGMLPAVGGAIIGSVVRLCLMSFSSASGDLSAPRILMLLALVTIGWIRNPHALILLLGSGALVTGASLAGLVSFQ